MCGTSVFVIDFAFLFAGMLCDEVPLFLFHGLTASVRLFISAHNCCACFSGSAECFSRVRSRFMFLSTVRCPSRSIGRSGLQRDVVDAIAVLATQKFSHSIYKCALRSS